MISFELCGCLIYIHTVLLSQSLDVSKNLSVNDYQEYKHNKVVDADNRAIGSQQLVNAVHIDSSWLEQSIAVHRVTTTGSARD